MKLLVLNKTVAVMAIASVASLVAASGVAYAVTAGSRAEQPAQQKPHATAVVSAALDGTTTSTFTPVTACRIVDTRKTSPLKSTVERDFFVGGTTGFAPQGGTSGGCGIPVQATAVQATVTLVGASANGFLHVWPQGATEPTASFMNFAKVFNVSSTGNVITSSAGEIAVKALGASSNVVIDVSGFYLAPLSADINSDATISHSSRVTGASKLATGQYEVDFDRDVSGCSYAVTPFLPGYTVAVEPRSTNVAGVFVALYNSSGTYVDNQFFITVTC